MAVFAFAAMTGSAAPQVVSADADEATATAATLTAPASVPAGATFQVKWTGPSEPDDWIVIAAPGSGSMDYVAYAYVRRGGIVKLDAPLEPGDYELRYLERGEEIASRAPITVTEVIATIKGPASAPAGSYPSIEWTGPGGRHDWITVIEPGEPDDRYTDYAYVRAGSPLTIRMPLEPGAYELRYVQAGRSVLGRQLIEVTPATADLQAADTIVAGADVEVAWTGPGEKGDFITIATPDASDNKYTDYARARRGSPSTLQAPVTPGAYEYRYVLDGKRVIARRAVNVEAPPASLSATSPAYAGEFISIDWTGPANLRDYIAIADPDAPANQYHSRIAAAGSAPVALRAPRTPGVYQLRYVLRGKYVLEF
ncbi:MAG: hypothetical protein AAGL49_10670, partial [Pseudomonadota bacterium]